MPSDAFYNFYEDSSLVVGVGDHVAMIDLGKFSVQLRKLKLVAPHSIVRIDDVRRWMEDRGHLELGLGNKIPWRSTAVSPKKISCHR